MKEHEAYLDSERSTDSDFSSARPEDPVTVPVSLIRNGTPRLERLSGLSRFVGPS
ncbi:hypothetical protein DVH05_008401 [Phytophthora capsici]|nr:hypothetical protein DVH05_008401 [Phytophthora capsici]